LAAARGGSPSPTATRAESGRLEKHAICALSGMRASRWCPTQTEEWTAGDAATGDGECTWHTPRDGGAGVRWPLEYVPWARGDGFLDRVCRGAEAAAPRGEAVAIASTASTRLRVVNPPDGAIYLIDPTLRRDFQTLPLRAAANSAVEWRIDGTPVGRGDVVDW